jgi:anaerobic selenocysteine-containing dehydrogenase
VHAALDAAVLDRPANADGVLAPPTATAVTIGNGATAPPSDDDAPGDAPTTDEAAEVADTAADAHEGDASTEAELTEAAADDVEAAEGEGDSSEQADAESEGAVELETEPAGPTRPAALDFVAPAAAPAPGATDAYSLRLVTRRRLYDRGTTVTHSPSLAPLAPGPSVSLHPIDFDKVGVAEGTEVRVVSAAGSVVIPIASDTTVPRGRAVVLVNQGARVTDLLRTDLTAVDVRVEVV